RNAMADAFGLEREVVEVSGDATDDVDAATSGEPEPDSAGEPSAQRGGAPLGGARPMGGDDGPTVSAQEGGDLPAEPEPEPEVDPGVIETEATSEGALTSAPEPVEGGS